MLVVCSYRESISNNVLEHASDKKRRIKDWCQPDREVTYTGSRQEGQTRGEQLIRQ